LKLCILKNQILLILDNIDKIDSKYWQDLEHYPDKKVIWFLNRQRPNVEADYSFDEERIGITNQREIVWGFDSGCSCPSPWIEGNL